MGKTTHIKLIIAAVLVIGIMTALFLTIKNKTSENLEGVSIKETPEYLSLPDKEALLILEDEIYTYNCIIRDNERYIRFDLVKSKFNDGFFWDDDEDTCIYVLPDSIIHLPVGEKTYTVNGESKTYTAAPVIQENNTRYMSCSFLEQYSELNMAVYSDPERVMIQSENREFLYYDTVDETPVHFEPDISSGVLKSLSAGEKVYYISGTPKRDKEFLKIMTSDGIYGYIQKKHVGESYYKLNEIKKIETKEFYRMLDETVILGWHQIAGKAGNDTYSTVTKNVKNMNVISPTWLRLASTDGDITSIGTKEYVDKAHSDGYKVWVLIDNFDDEVSSLETLSNTVSRENLSKNLVDTVSELGADGINIDFEGLSRSTGIYFVEFVKELSVHCHYADLTLSIDDYVPSEYRNYYDIETQAKYADYVILMAYDEHYAGSPTAGSVSSIGFVRDAINNALKMAKKEHIICALPFYTRVWKEEVSGVSSEALTMKYSITYLSENGVTPVWDEKTAQNYAEFVIAGTTYKIWVEDAQSLSYKLREVTNAGLSGVAFWRLGQETEDAWTIINMYFE